MEALCGSIHQAGSTYQEGRHVVLLESDQQGLEDIQDVAPVGAQLCGVGSTCSAKS